MNAREINANAVVIKAIKHPQNMSWDGFSDFTESTVAFIVVEHLQVEGIGKNRKVRLFKQNPTDYTLR